MYSTKITEIDNANNRCEGVRLINNDFLNLVRANAISSSIDEIGKLEISDQVLCVSAFGYSAEAKPRFIRSEDKNFYVEYVFLAKHQEIFRFYLTNDRSLVRALTEHHKDVICDSNNLNAPKKIYYEVLDGMLQSALLRPSAKQAI